MSKEKSLETTKLPKGNHNFPRCMKQFKEAFELLKKNNLYIEQVYPGRYRKIKTKEKTLEIKGYYDQTSFYKIDIKYKKFMQTFLLQVLPKNKKEFENYLEKSLS
ncbi:MAG: hypothetical protein U9Q99_02345 [Nanoarchaeota archaeon]|nr:hypothetical protein [Nanoarchaeota archaeon]